MHIAYAFLIKTQVVVSNNVFIADEMHLYGNKDRKDFLDINAALGITDEVNVEIKDEFAMVRIICFENFCIVIGRYVYCMYFNYKFLELL